MNSRNNNSQLKDKLFKSNDTCKFFKLNEQKIDSYSKTANLF